MIRFISRNRHGWYLGLIFVFVFIPFMISVALWFGFRTPFVATTLSLKASDMLGQYVHIGKVVPQGFGGVRLYDVWMDGSSSDKPLFRAAEVSWNQEGMRKLRIQKGEIVIDTTPGSSCMALMQRLKSVYRPSSRDSKKGEGISGIFFQSCTVRLVSKNISIGLEDVQLQYDKGRLTGIDIGSALVHTAKATAQLRLHYSPVAGAVGTVSAIIVGGVQMPSIEISPVPVGGAQIVWADMCSVQVVPRKEQDVFSGIRLQQVRVDFNEVCKNIPRVQRWLQSFLVMDTPILTGELRYVAGASIPVTADCVIEGSQKGIAQRIPLHFDLIDKGTVRLTSASQEDVLLLRRVLRFPSQGKTSIIIKIAGGGLQGAVENSLFTVEIPRIGLTVKDIRTEAVFPFTVNY